MDGGRTPKQRFVSVLRGSAEFRRRTLALVNRDESELWHKNYRASVAIATAAIFIETQMDDDDPDLAFLADVPTYEGRSLTLTQGSLALLSRFGMGSAEWEDGGLDEEQIRRLLHRIRGRERGSADGRASIRQIGEDELPTKERTP